LGLHARGGTALRRHVALLFIIALCLATISCTKLNEGKVPTGALVYENSRFADAIPQEYGTLIAVNQSPNSPEWMRLWFQKSDGSITVVFIDTQDARLGTKVLKIPRK
jgi:hypothetical protein